MSAGTSWLWIPITVCAALAQVIRNGTQAGLTARIGTLGATQVRFVFGLPFAAMFLLAWLFASGAQPPAVSHRSAALVGAGAVCQIVATSLMLVVMRLRAFSVAYTYIKTEPILVAVLGVLLIGDHLPPLAWLAVAVVTAGVLLAAVKPGHWRDLLGETWMIVAGIAAGGLYGLSAILFRAGINALGSGDFITRSLTMLVVALVIQAVMLGLYLALIDRRAFLGSLREWRRSLGAGFSGAATSAGWFAAFALTAAANVRTLGLVEMPIAALLAGRLTGKRAARQELAGIGVVMAGLILLVWASAGT